MTRRSIIWWTVGSLFTVINVGGAWYAAVHGEGLHTAVHVGLLLVGSYVAWRFAPRAGRQELPREEPAEDHLDRIQQSVDAIALEVERIGEAQRFSVKLQQERTGIPR